MNIPSVIVLIVILALCAVAVWRVYKKGAPCLCDGKCSGGCPGCKCKKSSN